jgi:hypothetical protein
VRHPEPSPGRADLRVPGRAGDVEHAELGEGGRRNRRRRDAAEAAEAAVLEAAALARPAADPHRGAARLMRRRRRRRRQIMLPRRVQSLVFRERRAGTPWPSCHVVLAEAYRDWEVRRPGRVVVYKKKRLACCTVGDEAFVQAVTCAA